MDDEAEITETMVDDVRIVRVAGELDGEEGGAASRGLAPPPDGALATVVDLSRVTFADSSFLHALLTAQRHHDRAGVPFVLAEAASPVRRLLELTDTARAFTLVPHLTAAMDVARARGADRRRP
ncbi:STAS domain-containing protein [Streptomyces sp. NPDC093094]|uniref:STAS domain-containing protein n=1 Tax=Streptomyces sp. NPDC093094 TaxID=3366026 RepID=UPI00382A8B22